ncbi:MAG: hypothetical protein ABR927_16725 [Bacteroidales bacterium]
MSKKEKERFEISEMFMAKADKNRCFFGCIKRLKDDNCNPFVFSRMSSLTICIVSEKLNRNNLARIFMKCE